MAMPIDSSFLHQVCATSNTDFLVFDIKRCSNEDCNKFKFVDDFLYFNKRLYVPKVHYALKSCKLNMIFQPPDILDTTKHWNSFLEIFCGLKCRRLSKILYFHVAHAPRLKKTHNIVHTGYCNHYLFRTSRGLLFLWISLPTYHHQTLLILYLSWLTN